MNEVADLAASLSSAVLHARMTGRGVSDEQVYALAKAARLFQDRGEPWPPILEQVLHELTAEVTDDDAAVREAVQAVPDAPLAEYDLSSDDKGMMRYFNALRRKKD